MLPSCDPITGESFDIINEEVLFLNPEEIPEPNTDLEPPRENVYSLLVQCEGTALFFTSDKNPWLDQVEQSPPEESVDEEPGFYFKHIPKRRIALCRRN